MTLRTERIQTLDHLARRIDGLDVRIKETTRPFSAALALLQTMPGVRPLSARAILAEIGDDMTKFPTARHFASWARVCPGNHESAGKRRLVSTGRGNAWLRDALSQVAWGAARRRTAIAGRSTTATRGGPKKAIVAVQHAILVAIWHMFSTGAMHEDLGPDHFRTDRERQKRYCSIASAGWAWMSACSGRPRSRSLPRPPPPPVSQKNAGGSVTARLVQVRLGSVRGSASRGRWPG